ncbi:MAG: c-type cytochrome biogenesis protein CcmI [Kordiimonadaceae bacterium]|nr:c-type cytochrome biogenesis protein CcmI [Kordiimonadaceae bacterium]MBT6037577.1 c-type cytochrome biogenesis protein CcmI [Kordiimonadaceae bacterium]MBT6328823.1 c-type cytochrome biogenesis protein CcmI [Kordiimonadaceae bacterium]MBT7582892.1 c-type cytochrome biogenesis protein CcmI [Kordiimonadaceae bacterium]
MIYIIPLILASIIALLFLLVPYFKNRESVQTEAPDIAVYKAQLNELTTDTQRGVISEEAAKTARLEIERRILKAADQAYSDVSPERPNYILALSLIVIILISPAFYAILGTPGMPDFPRAQQIEAQTDQAQADQIAEGKRLIAQQKVNLIKDASDARGWAYLSNLELTIGNFQGAAEALYNAHMLEPESFEYQLMYAEALIMASSERVIPAAMIILKKAEALNPDHYGPKYYLALADYQAGDIERAHSEWLKISTGLAEGNPLKPLVDFWVGKAAQDLGLAEALPQTRAPSISSEQAEVIQNMSDGERQDLIRQMVSQLADKQVENPANIEGWLRLSQAYMVLGDKEQAIDAMKSAISNAPDEQKANLQKELEKLTGLE